MKLHRILFYIYLFLIPIQTRILYMPDRAYVSWYFNYNLAFFVYLSDIVLFLCFTTWLVFDRPQIKGMRNKHLLLLFLGFILVSILSLLHVKHVDLAAYGIIKWIELFTLLLYIVVNLKAKIEYLTVSTIIFASAIFQAIFAWLQFHMQHMIGLKLLGEYIAPLGTSGLATIDLSAGKIVRAYGTFSHPNVLGAFLVLGIACGLILVSHATSAKFSTYKQSAILLGLFLLYMGLFATFSRVAWAAGGIATISFAVYYFRSNGKKLAWLILIPAIVSCATVLVFYKADLHARVSDSNATSVTDRYFFNGLGLDLIKRHPALGVGVGNYVPALTDLYKLEAWQYQPAHNIFIFLAAELGLLGLAIFLWILYEIFSKVKSAGRGVIVFGFTSIGILFLIMGQFDHYFVTIQQGRLMLFTVLGLIAALPNLNSHEKTT